MDILRLGLREWDIELLKRQEEQFETYYRLLIEWNRKMNLTAVTEYNDVQTKHFLDSLSIVKVLDFSHIHKILDLGTGAGFPGIPLKILFPSLELTLVDSLNKRICFLDAVIQELNLQGVNTIHSRAEELARQKDYRESYDLCVSRAVANLSTLSEYCLPFVKKGGYFVAFKGADVKDEISSAENALKVLGGKIEDTAAFTLPETDYGRTLVRIVKIRNTPKKYPRKAGTPSRDPL